MEGLNISFPRGRMLLTKPPYKSPSPMGDCVYNQYTFTGRTCDRESGLLYFRARMYSADLGRFISRDPMQYPDGWNWYAGWFILSGVDTFGLYDITTENMPEGRIELIKEQINSIRAKLNRLIPELEDKIKELSICPDCYGKISNELEKLKKACEKMKTLIDDPTEPLKLNEERWRSSEDSVIRIRKWGTPKRKIEINTGATEGTNFWTPKSENQREESVFHELLHDADPGIKDPKEIKEDQEIPAHVFARVISLDSIDKWQPLTNAWNACKKKMAEGKCCCPPLK